MAHASEPLGTIDPKEAAHFGRMAADWWNPKGSSALLHKMNPVRLGYLRDRIDHHWSLDEHERRPLAGRRVADIGCGAGLLAEPLARLGGQVTAMPLSSNTRSSTSASTPSMRAAAWPAEVRIGSCQPM